MLLTAKQILVILSVVMLIALAVIDQARTPTSQMTSIRSSLNHSQDEGIPLFAPFSQIANITRNAFPFQYRPKFIQAPAPGPMVVVTSQPLFICSGRVPRKYPHFSYPSVHPSNWTYHVDATNAKFTYYEIVNRKQSYSPCDELELRIFARNGRNESKQHGGDYFRAKISTSNKTYSASSSTDGEVVDNNDGTYSAYFTLKWTGVVKIIVSLMYSSEAVHVLDGLRRDHQPRQVFLGSFVSSDQKKSKESYCNFQLRNSTVEFCNFTDPNVGSPWFCEKPKGFRCSDWEKHRIDGKGSGQESTRLTNITERDAFNSSKSTIKGPVQSIKVIHSNVTQMKPRESLPVCTIALTTSSQPEVAGYYERDTWKPSSCRIHRLRTKAKMQECLSNKEIHLLGDSTIRQLHEYYKTSLNLTLRVGGKQKNTYTGPLISTDVKQNISIFYAFHTVPVGRNSWTFAEDTEYIANRIDMIDNSTDYPVVVVSLWAHFCASSTFFYEQRVRGIVNAMGRLLDRNERAVVIFKGANTREHKNFSVHACCSDWYARDMEARMRAIIFQDKRIGFIDAWDMTNAQTVKDAVHPTGSHIPNLNDQLLTLLGCS